MHHKVMKLKTTLFLLLIYNYSYSQFPRHIDFVSVIVSNSYNQPIDAKVEIIGYPASIFINKGQAGNQHNLYILDKINFPINADTTYYLKVSAPGYETYTQKLTGAYYQVNLFKPNDTYVYEGNQKIPAYHSNMYLACIYQGDSSKLMQVCNDYKIKIVHRYNYCGGGIAHPFKKLPPNTFVFARSDDKPFTDDDTLITAFRNAFPNNGGTFYSRGPKANIPNHIPSPILIYYNNDIEIYLYNADAYNKAEGYLKAAGISFKRSIYSHNIINASLPISWNINKVNSFIEGMTKAGITPAQPVGITALECPTGN